MSDLISREDLKKAFSNNCVHNCYYCKLSKWDKKGTCYNCGLIDNAPTADDWQKFSDELWKNAYKEGYKQAIRDGKTKRKN